MRPDKADRFFYGWYIVGIAFIANFMAVGTVFYAFNAFMEPLCESRGWTRTDINGAIAIGEIFGFFSQLLYGTLIMRIGPRLIMPVGAIVSGIAFIFLMQTQVLLHFYLFSILLFLGTMAYGGIAAYTVVNNWFVRKRGSAMGFATAGMSLSGVILPFAAMIMILHSGMANTSLWIGISIIAVGPLAWWVVRDWPEDYGLAPDGIAVKDGLRSREELTKQYEKMDKLDKAAKTFGVGIDEKKIWTLPMLLQTGAFWKAGLAFSLIMTGMAGVMFQLKPRFVDIGFSDLTAMAMMAATAFFGTIGKYVWGALCDRFEPKRVVAVLMIAKSLGLALGLLHGSVTAIVLFIIFFGFAMGGIWSTYPIIVADFFGRKSFPAVFRFISFFLLLQMSGFIIAGQSFDRMGSYDPAYMLFIGFDFIAVLLILSIRRPGRFLT